MHSLFVPNIALFPTYLSYFAEERLSCFENLAIVSTATGFRYGRRRDTCFITCVFIYIIYRFFTSISLDKTSRYCDHCDTSPKQLGLLESPSVCEQQGRRVYNMVAC
jgi:hypothetical protein